MTQEMELHGLTFRPKLYAALLAGFFFGVGGLWASFAPLSAAAIAAGHVSPEGRRLTIQHLEGGVISALEVKEGDKVRAGDPLVTLANVRAQSERDTVHYEYLTLLLEEARLVAEFAGRETFVLPLPVAVESKDPAIAEMISAAKRLHGDRAGRREARDKIYEGRIAQLEKQIEGSTEFEASIVEQLRIISEEIADLEPLVVKGLTPRNRLRALQRESARLEGQVERTKTDRAARVEAMETVRLERLDEMENDRQEASEQLVEVRRRLNAARAELPSTEDELARTQINAPADGTVVEMKFTTVGGVVGSGVPIMDLVPSNAELVVEARVNPADIDDVVTGQEARVVLSAYRQRNMPPIVGSVRTVSADRILDEATNTAYFLATVEVPQSELEWAKEASAQDVELLPGMPAEVMIITSERTMLEYLFDPFFASMRRSFRES